MIRLIPMLLLVTAACAPVTPLPSPTAMCNAAAASRLIGQPLNDNRVQRAKRLSRAREVRTIRPGQPVTMDFREDRLNVEVDNGGVIRIVRCG